MIVYAICIYIMINTDPPSLIYLCVNIYSCLSRKYKDVYKCSLHADIEMSSLRDAGTFQLVRGPHFVAHMTPGDHLADDSVGLCTGQ